MDENPKPVSLKNVQKNMLITTDKVPDFDKSLNTVRKPAKIQITEEANNPEFIISILDMDRDEGVKCLKLNLSHVQTNEAASIYMSVVPILLEWCIESGWKYDGTEIIKHCFTQPAFKPFLREFIIYVELRWNKYSENIGYNKRKQLPMAGQGVIAQPPSNGMQTTLTWLKSIRLHKYWPLISNFTYRQLLSIKDDNFEIMVSFVGATTVTKGARGKLIKEIKALESRSEIASLPQENDKQILMKIKQLEWITETPLSSDPDPDGTYLLPLIRKALSDVTDAALYKTDSLYILEQLLSLYDRITYNEILTDTVKEELEKKTCIEEKKVMLKEYYNRKQIWPTGRNQVMFKPPHKSVQMEDIGLLEEDTNNSFCIKTEEMIENIINLLINSP